MVKEIHDVAAKTKTGTPAHFFESPSVEDDGPGAGSAADVTGTIRRRGWAFLRVSGKSMLPWIREGDIVFLRQTPIREVVRGDVVVFRKNGTLCVHRVLATRGHAAPGESHVSLITKGDATADADSPVSFGDVLGRVEFVYRRNREIPMASGWRRYFGKLLSLLSPATPWLRSFGLQASAESVRSESRPLPGIEVQRSLENSAD